ncbi:hypothetical protein DNTS_022607, partial [Danionella cerebrum]
LDGDKHRASTEKTNDDAQTNNTEAFFETSNKRAETTDLNANIILSESSSKDSLQKEDVKPNQEINSNSVLKPPVTVPPVTSSTPSEHPPKVNTGPAQIRPTAPAVTGVTMVSSSIQGSGATSLALVPHAGRISVNTVAVSQPRVTTLATTKGTILTLPRISTPSQNVPLTRAPQTVPLQLPANFQVPQGMVLIRSDSGQLMLVSQQALAQAQAQGMVPKQATASSTAIVRPSSSQIKPNPSTVTVIQKPAGATGTIAFTPAGSAGSSIIRTAGVVASSATRKPGSTTGPIIKVAQMPPRTNAVTATTVINTSAAKVLLTSASIIDRTSQQKHDACPHCRARAVGMAELMSGATGETLENVKKCKNFLVTLMKLASSGTRSANMAQNVRALVKSLLDGKLEAEEFTEKLYMELKSSPQPFLVPFLKKSLPAVRQLTPNSLLFVQQCDQTRSSDSASIKATSQKPSGSALKPSQPTRTAQL